MKTLAVKNFMILVQPVRPTLLTSTPPPTHHRHPGGPDRYGGISLNASDHNVPHNLVRDFHFTTAVSAYGSNSVELEPTEHSIYSPGKRPDRIYLPASSPPYRE